MSASCSRHAPGRTSSTCWTPASAVGSAAASSRVSGGAHRRRQDDVGAPIARNIASAGSRVSYVCYEHTGQELLTRLLLMEACGSGSRTSCPSPGPPVGRTRHRPGSTGSSTRSTLWAATATGCAWCAETARRTPTWTRPWPRASRRRDPRRRLLQKVPSRIGGDAVEAERVTEVVERLKDHAMEHGVPVVAIVASDRNGLENARVRMQDLRGSTAVAYEADVALLLNEKSHVVARHHLRVLGRRLDEVPGPRDLHGGEEPVRAGERRPRAAQAVHARVLRTGGEHCGRAARRRPRLRRLTA